MTMSLSFCFSVGQVLIGGGKNHRMGLFDMVMIKDNHISTAGGVTNAIKSVDMYLKQENLSMEVEVLEFYYSPIKGTELGFKIVIFRQCL